MLKMSNLPNLFPAKLSHYTVVLLLIMQQVIDKRTEIDVGYMLYIWLTWDEYSVTLTVPWILLFH